MSGKRHSGCGDCFYSSEESGGLMPFKVCRPKMGGRKGKSDAGIDVQSKIILWSWTFSRDMGNEDPDSCPGSKQRLGYWDPSPQILVFLC